MADTVDRPEVRHAAFNSGGTHCCLTTNVGLHIFELTPSVSCVKAVRLENVSSASLLLNSNYVAYVKSLRSCHFFDYKNNAELKAHPGVENSDILDLLVTHSFVVVVLERAITIYTWPDRVQVITIETASNPAAACAVASTTTHDIVAFPAPSGDGSGRVGVLRLPKALLSMTADDHTGPAEDSSSHPTEDSATFSIRTPAPDVIMQHVTYVDAHKAPLACVALNEDGARMASMSETGTLLRVFDVESGKVIKELRRGHSSTAVHSIAFYGDEVCCYGKSGTLHVFSALPLESPSRFFDERAVAKHQGLSGEPGRVRFAPGKRRCLYMIMQSGMCHVVDFYPEEQSSGTSAHCTDLDLIQVYLSMPPEAPRRLMAGDNVRVVIDQPTDAATPRLTKTKFLVPRGTTMENVARSLRARLDDDSADELRLVLTAGLEKVPVAADLRVEEAAQYAGADGFLHLQYSVERS